MSDTLRSTLAEAISSHLTHLAEADYATYREAEEEGQAVMAALAQGGPLEPSLAAAFGRLMERHLAALTWQQGFEPVPRPPWTDVGPRLRKVQAMIEEAAPYLDEDARRRLQNCVRCAEGLQFRADWEVEAAEVALRRGELVRLPALRPVNASLGPTSWSASQGPQPRRRLIIQLGRDPVVLKLMLRQDRPVGTRRLDLSARAAEGSWVPVDYEPGTSAPRPVEGLDRVSGDPRLAGWHVAVLAHAALWSVAVEDLQSPLGVYVRIPEDADDSP